MREVFVSLGGDKQLGRTSGVGYPEDALVS